MNSDFKNLYKSGILDVKDQQVHRRARLLEEQRKKREDKYSGQRDIQENIKGKWKKQHREFEYRNNLMLSEWMMEIPDDLEDFLLMCCPKGIRCTLSNEKSRNNNCKLYYKNGGEFLTIKSNFPRNTVLDCIYAKSTLFILDVIKYDGREFIECDTAFRKYWIKTKFIENDLKIYENDENQGIKLQLIEAYDFADSHFINNCFQTYPIFDDDIEIDGFLFYHKEAFYTVGESPLVLWLFPFMIEDVLPMFKVHEYYNTQKPETYTNYLDYIYEFNLKLKTKKRRSKKNSENMDIQDADESGEQDEMQKMINLERFGDF